MLFREYISGIAKRKLSSSQKESLEGIAKISEKFHRDAGIEFPDADISPDSAVFESGHQPNFLPHAGTFKKAFLLHFLKEENPCVVPLFGFADYNLSTAPLLFQNRIPAINREGAQSIGCRAKPADRWKMLHMQKKPQIDVYEADIQKISSSYPSAPAELFDIMHTSYERAKNMADLNAYIFAGICVRILGVSPFFYRYTDVQNKHIFLSVWEDALENLSTFNETYNNAIREKNISDMHPVESNALPFWRHCTCGAKAAMHILDGRASGMCPSCGSDLSFELEDLKKVFSGLSPTAVSRNIFFAEGLGTSLFVSGSGGSLVYGKISNRVSARLGYFIPQTVAWKGRDYYIGPVQRKALEGLGLAVGCNLLKNPQIIPSAVASREQELQNRINKSLSDKKAVQKYSGQLTS